MKDVYDRLHPGAIYHDLENAGHLTLCDSEIVGIYNVIDLADGKVAFQTIDEGCSDEGFTRGYVFANVTLEWMAEPMEAVAKRDDCGHPEFKRTAAGFHRHDD